MTIPKGWDPSSLGLVRKGDNPNDSRFTPVEFDGRVIWALHPKHFNEATLNDIFSKYQESGIATITNDEIFVKDINIKGVKTNNHSTTINRYFVPVYAAKNFMGDYNSPAEYAQLLENAYLDLDMLKTMGYEGDGLINNIAEISMDELATIARTIGGVQYDENGEPIGEIRGYEPWRLNYTSSLFKTGEVHKIIEIDMKDLPGIDLNSSDNVSVKFADGNSLSYPLPNIMAGEDNDNHKLRIQVRSTHMHGFWYTAEFAGRTIQGKYSQELAHKAIVSEYSEHMLKNGYREILIHISRLYNTAKDVLSNFSFDTETITVDSGDTTDPNREIKQFTQSYMIDTAGGINSILNGVMDYATRKAMFSDMENTSRNAGGTVVVDAIDQIIDMFVEIDYPIANKLNTTDGKVITPSELAIHESHTYELNSRFKGVSEFLNFVKSNYPGQVVGMDVDIVFEYGRYNEYFSKLVNKGALNDDTE